MKELLECRKNLESDDNTQMKQKGKFYKLMYSVVTAEEQERF